MRLMVRGGCLPVRGFKGMEWKYDDDLSVCGTKETEIHVLFECKCYDMVRRKWTRTWDVLDEKEITFLGVGTGGGGRGALAPQYRKILYYFHILTIINHSLQPSGPPTKESLLHE